MSVAADSYMRWTPGYRSSDVDDRRDEAPARVGGVGGGGLPLGAILSLASRFGWKGILGALVLIGALSYAGTCQSDAPTTDTRSQVADRPAGQDDAASFVGFVLDDVQKTYAKDVPNYRPARLELFRRAIKTNCGTATAAVGPFYCPGDEKAYIDLAFYDDLRTELGAPGDFAQAYVIAHELGHHVQNLRGEFKGGGSIAIELQADCFAGAWAKDAEARGLLEVGDIDEALNAAAQIGDDTLQKKAQGYVQPETWTHGSSAQRSGSFKQGYKGGFHACDSIVASN
jgi:hypothetical protein